MFPYTKIQGSHSPYCKLTQYGSHLPQSCIWAAAEEQLTIYRYWGQSIYPDLKTTDFTNEKLLLALKSSYLRTC
jgi:hypothetical protein